MSSGTFYKGGINGTPERITPPGQTDQQYYQPAEEEGLIPKIGRNIGANLIKSVGAAADTLKAGSSMIGRGMGGISLIDLAKKGIGSQVEKSLPEGYLEPRNKYEAWGHEVLPHLPIALVSGTGSLLTKLASFGSSALASKGVEKLGGGPLLQFAAGYGAGRVPRLMGKGLSAKSLVNKAETEYKRDFNVAAENLKKMGNPSFKSAQFDKDLREVVKRYDDMLPKTKRAVRPQLEHLLNQVEEVQMSIAKAWDLEKQFGKEANFHGKSGNVQDFYKLVRTKLSNFVDEAAKAKPEFGEPYLRANDLYKGFKAQEEIGDVLKSPQGMELLARVGKSTKALIGGNLKGAVMHLASKDYAHNREIAEELMAKSKVIQQHVQDLKRDAYLGDKMAVLSKIQQIDNEMKQEEYKRPQGRFIKGGLKNYKPTGSLGF